MKELISIIYQKPLQLFGAWKKANAEPVIAPQSADFRQNHRTSVYLVTVEKRDFGISP